MLATLLLAVAIAPNGFFAQSKPSASRAISFPQHSRAVSPDGRYVIVGVDSDTEPHHTVFLDDRRLKTRRKLFNYDRSIDLLWNPDSKSFALTDHAGSDYSKCKIIPVDENAQSIDVWEAVFKEIKGEGRRRLVENHHVYIAATGWVESGTLRVKVWGYGAVSRAGFRQFYTYEMSSGIVRLQH